MTQESTPTASQSEAMVEELAPLLDDALGEPCSYEIAGKIYRAILPILERERADAFDDGIRSTFEQRAMDLKDARAAGKRAGIEEAAKVICPSNCAWDSEMQSYAEFFAEQVRALAEKQP